MGLGGGLAGRGAPGPVVSVPPPAWREALLSGMLWEKGELHPPRAPMLGPGLMEVLGSGLGAAPLLASLLLCSQTPFPRLFPIFVGVFALF